VRLGSGSCRIAWKVSFIFEINFSVSWIFDHRSGRRFERWIYAWDYSSGAFSRIRVWVRSCSFDVLLWNLFLLSIVIISVCMDGTTLVLVIMGLSLLLRILVWIALGRGSKGRILLLLHLLLSRILLLIVIWISTLMEISSDSVRICKAHVWWWILYKLFLAFRGRLACLNWLSLMIFKPHISVLLLLERTTLSHGYIVILSYWSLWLFMWAPTCTFYHHFGVLL